MGTSQAQHVHLVWMVRRARRVQNVQRVRTCHTAASLRPSRSDSTIEVALLSLGLEALQHGALLPVGLMAMDDSTTAIIELHVTLCRAGLGVPCVLKRASPRSGPWGCEGGGLNADGTRVLFTDRRERMEL